MKTKLAVAAVLLAVFLAPSHAQAQANAANYAFSTTTSGSLTNMSSGTTTLINPDQDDTASPVTLIGFDVVFMGVRQDRFSVNSNGSLRFGSTAISTTLYDPLAQAGQALITAYGADQRTHAGDGKVHFKVIGSAPNRTLVVEWLNMQSDFNTGGTAGLTYQVRLTETSGTIEFAYGSMTMGAAGAADPNSNSPQFGFSSNNAVGTVGSITAAQGGAPAPTFNGASATPVNNLYVAGAITVLTSAVDGSRRTFLLTPPSVNPPGGPMTFTAVTPTSMTLNWTDSSNELGYLIYNSTDAVNFTFVNTAAQNSTSFAASGLIGSTTYTWRVVAVSEGATNTLSGSQATAAPTTNSSLGTGLWSAPGTWSTGIVPTANDAVTISAGTTVTIDTASSAYSVTIPSGGVLQFEQTTARTLTLATDVSIQSGGTFQSNPAGTQTGHVLSIPGNLVNNGTLDFSTNADTAGAIITFTGANNTTFSGSGATNDIRQITVNKGTTSVPIVEILTSNFTVRGVTTDTVVGGWLVMTNGTLKLSGSFSGTSRVFSAAGYTIAATQGFWLNNPNYTVAGQNGSPAQSGLLRISTGTFNIGTSTGNSMGFSTGSTTIVEGGAVNATGRFGVAAAGNTITYQQSAGTVTVCTIGNASATLGSFDLGTSLASSIAVSGGTIVTQINATAIDYRMQSGGGFTSLPGGTLQLGNAASGAAKTFNLRGVLPALTVITNTSAGHSGVMFSTPVNFNNLGQNININSGATFNTGNVTFLVTGTSFTNNGTLTANGASSNVVWFDAGGAPPQTYSGNGVTTAPITAVSMQNPGGLTLSSTNQFVTNRLILFVGNVSGASKFTLGTGGVTTGVVQIGNTTTPTAAGTFDSAPVFNLGTGGQNISYLRTTASRLTGPEVNPTRTLTNFSYDDNDPTHTLTLTGGDLTATGTTTLTNGRVITGAAVYFVGTAGTVTRTNGYIDGNLSKPFAAAASATFEVGTANGYTPVVFNVTAGTFPTFVVVAAVQTPAPGVQPLTKVLNRSWRFTATGITSDITVSYLDPTDIPGTVTEANLHFLRHEAANPSDYSDQGGTVNTAANTATVTGVTSFSPWTLGEVGADLGITKSDGVGSATPGGTVTYTITGTNGGTVGNPSATVTDNFPAGLTCSTTCVGAGGGTCTAGPFAGNISDPVNIPSGGTVTYTATCSVNALLTGSLSNTASIAGGALTDFNNADNSSTDTDLLAASADLAITKTDGVTTATPGGSVTYTITASNAGPSAATGSTVADTFPASLSCSTTCVGAGGGTCTAGPFAGNINDSVNLPAGGSVTYTSSCTISSLATGSLSNTATVTAPGGVSDPTPGNNSATDTDTLTPSADVAITKTDGVTTATAGGSVTYTITASNAGPSAAPGSTVADTFPASLTCSTTCVGAGGGTCTAGPFAGNINDSVNLPSGGSVTYTSACSLSAAATGTLSNTATVAAPAGVTDPTPGNNSSTDSDTIAASADLAITKTDGVTSVTPGGSTTYTITASNPGPSNATGATVADTFPASLTCSTTCVGAGGGTCTAGPFAGNIADTVNLPSGGSVTYTASCTISGLATGTLSNTATVAAPAGVTDPTPGNNSSTDSDTITASADLAITKTDGVTSATAGGSVTYTITASNAGPSAAPASTVADTFPASLTCSTTCVGAGGGSCTAGPFAGNINDTVNLPSGGSVTYTASCTISSLATGSLTNTATVSAPGGVTDPNPGNNSATDVDALGASADLAITKTDGVTTATAGGSVTYTITASNAGPSAASGSTVADTFPASLTCSTTCVGAGGGTCTAGPFAGNINDTVNLPSGGSVTYTASCTISAGATGSLSNTATVTAPAGVTDPTPGNNSSTDVDALGASADLSINKTDGVTTATAGGSTTYTITASNAGPSNATGSTVADTFPASLTCSTTCVGAGGGTCTAGPFAGNINDTVNLPSGGSVTYTASCTISSLATGTLSNTATVAAPAGVTDTAPGNNSSTDSDTLTGSADLSINKNDGVTTATPGGSVTYTITASNAGPSSATGATVADTFPASLSCTWTCAGAGGGTCTASGSGNINNTVNLPSGGSVTYTATCTISAFATGTLSNTATVTAPAGVTDSNPGNNSATDSDTLAPNADLAITKTDGVTTVTAGGSTTYTITASNAGPSNATGATVADTFPASLTCTWTCAGAGGGTCTASGSGNINDTTNLPSGGSVIYTAACTISGLATGTLSNTATVTAPAGVTDSNPANNSATDSDTVSAAAGASVSGTKTVTGPFSVGNNVTYTVTLTNNGTGAQANNPGNEFTDVLPAQVALVSATATSGTAVATIGTNTVTWNGGLAGGGGSVTITITATILPTPPGTTVSNQGTIAFDSDGNGTNDASALTDDPSVAGPANPTSFVVTSAIPAVTPLGLALLAAMLTALGFAMVKRQ